MDGTLLLLGIVGSILVLTLIIFGWVILLYNGLVSLKVLVEEAWSGIDVQLKKRYDLIPNIVETVKGYASHEKDTFSKVVELRNVAMGAISPQQKAQADNSLAETLKSLFALAEDYPDLKADKSFLSLQNSLSDIEQQIQSARRYYNGVVRDYNTKIKVFPNNLLAGVFGFTISEFFEANKVEKENVEITF